MSRPRVHPGIRIAAVLILLVPLVVIVISVLNTPRQHSSPRRQLTPQVDAIEAARAARQRDAALVRGLIAENLDDRRFLFGTVMQAASGKRVLGLDSSLPSHRRILAAIEAALTRATESLSRADSPVRRHRRINEVSSDFEEALRLDLDAMDGLSCHIPVNRKGDMQRSGYPDLRLVDEASGEVFYLDPKLVENGSWDSSFRTFYFEPKDEHLKINDDAVHLLIGIGHDGQHRAWTFGPWRVIDLSTITLRLKPEFQASNREALSTGRASAPTLI